MKMLIYCFKRIHDAIKRKGFLLVLVRTFQAILAVPIATLVLLMWPFFKIRFISLYTSRIGQYGSNTHLLLCALESGDFPEEKKCKHFFYSYQDGVPICNLFFHKMWSRVIVILPCGALWSFVDRILIFILRGRYQTDFKKIFESSVGGCDWWNYFSNIKKPFLSFTENEIKLGNALLNQLGVPAGKRFVCLLVRDDRYLQLHINHSDDWRYHSYRNASIDNYISAIELLTQNDIYVIRMGKHVASPLEINNAKLIDYANHPLRSDFLDVFLSANCFFFISTSCGIDCIPQLFYKPLLITNGILSDIQSCAVGTRTIFKNVICAKTNKLISYREIYQDYEYFFLSGRFNPPQDPRRQMFAEWERKEWLFVENTPDDIGAAVKEMLDLLLQGSILSDDAKALEQRFWNSFSNKIMAKQIADKKVRSHISSAFLNKYRHLFASEISETVM